MTKTVPKKAEKKTTQKKKVNETRKPNDQTLSKRKITKGEQKEEQLFDTGEEITTNWKTKVGRPFKFDPDKAIALMNEAIESYISGKFQYHDSIPTDEEGKRFKLVGVSYPTITKIALMCGVDEETFVSHCTKQNENGSAKNEQLFGAYTRFKDLGKQMLIEGGLIGLYNERIVQFIGNVNYGMTPNSKTESTVELKGISDVYKRLDAIHDKEEQRLAQQRCEMAERKQRLDQQYQEENQ